MLRLTVFLLISLISIKSVATLIKIDDTGFGLESLTLDTTTNTLWLDISITDSFSYNEVNDFLNSDPRYSTYRFARKEEVFTLFLNAGIVDFSGDFTSLNDNGYNALSSTLGETYQSDVYNFIGGMVYSDTPNASRYILTECLTTDPVECGGTLGASYLFAQDNLTKNYNQAVTGSFLVRKVSEPETLLFFLIPFLTFLGKNSQRPLNQNRGTER